MKRSRKYRVTLRSAGEWLTDGAQIIFAGNHAAARDVARSDLPGLGSIVETYRPRSYSMIYGFSNGDALCVERLPDN